MEDLKRLKDLAGISEGWMRHSGNTFTADAAEIEHHLKSNGFVSCPGCKTPIQDFKTIDNYAPIRDAEGEILEWAGNCPKCKCKLTIFND